MSGKGLDLEGRQTVQRMMDEKQSGTEVREKIDELAKPWNECNYEANRALKKEMEDREYTESAKHLGEKFEKG